VNPLAASSDQKPSTPARASSGSASSAAPVTGEAASASARAESGTLTPNTDMGRSGKSSAYPFAALGAADAAVSKDPADD
jgi:hypothetical protein